MRANMIVVFNAHIMYTFYYCMYYHVCTVSMLALQLAVLYKLKLLVNKFLLENITHAHLKLFYTCTSKNVGKILC